MERGRRRGREGYVFVNMYIYMYINICIYIYVYIYIKVEKESFVGKEGKDISSCLSLLNQMQHTLYIGLFVALSIIIWVMIITYSYSMQYGGMNKESYLQMNVDLSLLQSVAIAPYGALIRYALWHTPILTSRIDKAFPNFKIPTLAVNLTGALLVSLVSSSPNGRVRSYGAAFGEGFCGSLTTVSTLFIELHLLHKKGPGRSMLYALVTFIGGVLVALFPIWGFRG
jgi:fluoride ion exporter CrcB/FEX